MIDTDAIRIRAQAVGGSHAKDVERLLGRLQMAEQHLLLVLALAPKPDQRPWCVDFEDVE